MKNIFEKIKEKLEYARVNCIPRINGRDCTVEELNVYNMAFTYAKKIVDDMKTEFATDTNIKNNDGWILFNPENEDTFPKNDDYILVSFKNAGFVHIGRWEQDKDGGAFYPGDLGDSYASVGLIVNAWRPLPKPYREEEDDE